MKGAWVLGTFYEVTSGVSRSLSFGPRKNRDPNSGSERSPLPENRLFVGWGWVLGSGGVRMS